MRVVVRQGFYCMQVVCFVCKLCVLYTGSVFCMQLVCGVVIGSYILYAGPVLCMQLMCFISRLCFKPYSICVFPVSPETTS